MPDLPRIALAAALALLSAGCLGGEVFDDCEADADCDEGEVCSSGACVAAPPGCPEIDQREWFEDRDGDELGGESLGGICVRAEPPRGALQLGGDCDDANPDVGQFFPDVDGDGAGAIAGPPACTTGPGFLPTATDCDDTDPTVRPDTAGICARDGANALALCPAGSPSCTTDAADAVLWGIGADAAGAVAVGDFDGDGFADVAVGAYNHPDTSERGRVYVLFGPVRRGDTALADEALILEAEGPSGALGASLASAGDVDGDGKTDLLVGTHHYGGAAGNSAGRAYLVLGEMLRRLRATPPAPEESIADAAATIYLEGTADRGTLDVLVIGGAELDGNPGDDVLLGPYEFDDPATAAAEHVGAVFVVPGSCRAAPGAPAVRVQLAGVPSCEVVEGHFEGAALLGDTAGSKLGLSVAAVDLDRDGALDLLAADRGGREVRGFRGPVSGASSWAAPEVVFTGASAVAACSGLAQERAGDLFLLTSPDGGATPALARLEGPFRAGTHDVPALAAGTYRPGVGAHDYGNSVSAPGDLDGDGVTDALVSAHLAPSPTGEGAAHVYSGASFRSQAPAGELVIRSTLSGRANFSANGAVATDFDRDGHLDLAITAGFASGPGPGDADAGAGAVLLFFGPWPGR